MIRNGIRIYNRRMKIGDFDYVLPKSFIAQEPVRPRDSSRLMVLGRKRQTVSHKRFFELPKILEERFGGDTVLVFNNSKVIPARVNFDIGGVKCEILLLKKLRSNVFECLVQPGRKFRSGAEFCVKKGVFGRVSEVLDVGTRLIKFKGNIEKTGSIPFPPYLAGTKASANDYQTIYARYAGSAAAPTAGLHFTPQLFKKLCDKGVETAFVTLHVGLGTFQPVKVERIQDHKMHSEYFTLGSREVDFLNKAKAAGKKIIAVGTTSVRVLETCADSRGKLRPQSGETDIFIYPGYEWKFVDGMITNFHLPKSTLIMLVSAFAGRNFVRSAYDEAKKQKYRFYSFGDAMLII